MSLLAPWFLAGFALIAGPIVFHLIRRATHERLAFSALRFLEVSAPRLDRRSRIQNPWLLALRCLIVAVLAFGFARPFFRQNAPIGPTSAIARHVVAILDESASMRRPGLRDASHERIASLAASLGPTDHLSLLSVGTRVEELLGDAQWRATPLSDRAALVQGLLASRAPGWGPTPLDAAAETALARWDEMAESAGGDARHELVIVSDFASGSRVAGVANIVWPANTSVRLESVTFAPRGNASLQWLGWATTENGDASARIRVSRTPDSTGPLQLRWHDAADRTELGAPIPVELLPGGSRVLLVPLPPDAAPALALDLIGDELDFDNHLALVHAASRHIHLVYLGADAADDSTHARFYLERAIAGWRRPTADISPNLPADRSSPCLLVIPAPLDAARIADVRARLEAGSFGLVLVDRDETVATAAALAGETGWIPLAPKNPDALFGQLDFQHPLFAPFADPLYSDFTRIRFWSPHPLALPATSAATVVARFDDTSSAVIETPVGRGRLIVFASGWSPKQSQWVLSSKFVPWLQALAERAAGGAERPSIAEIGDTARLGANIAAGSLATPGIHEIPDSGATRPIALNVPAAESQLEPLPLDTWEKLGVPLRDDTSPAVARSPDRSATAATLESRQQLWRWLLWLAAALLALESLASFALSRRTAETAH